MISHYSMLIQWSEEDTSYVVSFPEFPTAHTHGDSYEQAATNGREVLNLLIQTYEREGRPLPEPHIVTHILA
jgi:predicted RNase H-like HicB family nuclease